MNEIAIQTLVEQASAGDRAAFEQLVSRTQNMVLGVALRRLKNFAEASDLRQEVFVQVLRKLPQLRDPARFEPWVRKIAVRLAINKIDRRPKESRGDGQALDSVCSTQRTPIERIVQSEAADSVRKGISQLRELDSKTLLAFYFDGHTLQQMSDRFNSPIGTIKRRLHTARNRLRDKLGDLMLVG